MAVSPAGMAWGEAYRSRQAGRQAGGDRARARCQLCGKKGVWTFECRAQGCPGYAPPPLAPCPPRARASSLSVPWRTPFRD